MITYRNLLEAIERAHELHEVVDRAEMNPRCYKGTAQERDEAEAELWRANAAFSQEIKEFLE